MTPDSQRLAIGALQGKDATRYRFEWRHDGGEWKWSSEYYSAKGAERIRYKEAYGWRIKTKPVEPYQEPSALPDYLESLDAIMPVVRRLDATQQAAVYAILLTLVQPSSPIRGRVGFNHVNCQIAMATAAQWAEAYLRAMGEYAETS